MSSIDRRRLKSQEVIKHAVIELISEKNFDDITMQEISDRANVSRGTIYSHYIDKFDLLDKLIEEHMSEMQEMCESAQEMDYIDANQIWFEYIKSNYQFFSTMLASKGAPYFRTQFIEFLAEAFKNAVKVKFGKNRGLNEDIVLQFIMMSFVGIVEWWIKNKMPYPSYVMAEQVGILLERNL
ncbi:TetR/AcrR family transcriptional regulator [Lederbergia wuyishanensis]|uniref:AcrR family transcriptional regulator n=1 Tax=Lederbergia wuyishanensis TaxID=1347903 RepID=A0ABU0D5S6_9BACI|nr:TetR/AcrR family transcriptional regulator [Lederbergia wuyishanensis]MCJ8008294.1 TetR/AcrR family transcriptional regulator [Lederbergia wuyishanensis]MDQ0343706.1 AcrR family transcriptional regulator [Lederbergia wuyishanensis]